jgi:hypothetical protein
MKSASTVSIVTMALFGMAVLIAAGLFFDVSVWQGTSNEGKH